MCTNGLTILRKRVGNVIHVETYRRNILEIERLLHLAEAVPILKHPEHRRDLSVLNKSSVVLLVACWESFIEDLASTSFEFMLSHAPDHKAFPSKLLALTSRSFWETKDERGIWALAGDGWKAVLTKNKNEILAKHLGSFNTPRAEQVDTLFESVVGLRRLSLEWHWKGMNAPQARDKLGHLISLRGDIAHRVSVAERLNQQIVRSYANFIGRLCVVSSNALRSFIHKRVNKFPWNEVILTLD